MSADTTTSNVSPIKAASPAPESLRNRVSAAEWEARCELAAAYRLTAIMGWSDMLGTHISCRVPGTEDQFLINPYGELFEEITASSLIKCDTEGNKLSDSPYEINFAGFTIHSAIHMGRPDAHAVMHLHTGYGVAVSAQEDGLLPVTQKALTMPFSQLRYHDYEGVAHDLTERERLLNDMGDGTMLILRNHGTLTVGASCGEMWGRMYRLETACKFQILAMSGDAKLRRLPQEVIDHTTQQGLELSAAGGRHAGGKLLWNALLRKLAREQPEYAS